VTIPDTINGLAVAVIGDGAFSNSITVISATIPNSVNNMGKLVFASCPNLLEIYFQGNITNIENGALSNCTSLSSVYFSGDLPAIDTNVFAGSTNAIVYYLSGTIGWGANLGGCQSMLLPYTYTVDYSNRVTITKYTGSSSAIRTPISINGGPVISIGYRAFYYYPATNLVIGNNVTIIGESAFEGCRLKSFTSGPNVVRIDSRAFACSVLLTNIVITRNVFLINREAFIGCDRLTAFSVDTMNSYLSSSNGVLFNKNTTTLFKCPYAKDGTYIIPDSVTLINSEAFADCSSLVNIILGKNVSSIGTYAFGRCSKVKDVTIPDLVTNISDWAFFACTSLTNVTLGTNVLSIGICAFNSCYNLTGIFIPHTVTTIGASAFNSCERLTSIAVDVLNSKYNSISGVLFDKNNNLLIRYPAGLSWNYYTVPDSVTNIASSAFEKSGNLSAIYFKGVAPTLGSSVFAYATNAIIYYLPNKTGWSNSFGGLATVQWMPKISDDVNFGVISNSFGFNINWINASGMVTVVEACSNLTDSSWTSIQTNALNSDNMYFSDSDWTNTPCRYYRVSWTN
jgi:hypothetical protein